METKIQYYLDTSACIYFGKYLVNYSKQVSFLISALTFLELISPLYKSPSKLERIRSHIQIISESSIIDWRFPEELIAASYDNCTYRENRIESLQELIYSIKTGHPYEVILNSKKPFDLEYFSHYDEQLSHVLKIDNHRNLITMTKNILDQEKNEQTLFTEEETRLPNSEMLQLMNTKYMKLNFSLSVEVLGEWLLLLTDTDKNKPNIESICNSYNKKSSTFMTAYSYYTIDRMSRYEQSRRNDFIDLLHFLYINPSVPIISADNLILDIANRIRPGLGINAHKILKQ